MAFGIAQIALYLLLLFLLVKPLGRYMAQVYSGQSTWLSPLLQPVEEWLYRLAGVKPDAEMGWRVYAQSLLLFNGLGLLALYLLLRLQQWLPLNPQAVGPLRADAAFNAAISFVSNTNWQNYSGEIALSYLTQMVGLTAQNFLSAATGMAVLVALIRGLARQESATIGNYWVDMTRSILYILLPFSLLLALALVSQGVVQSFGDYPRVALLQPADAQTGAPGEQALAIGPAASQIAIKQLGSNGGGFFNANSAHPFENPTPLSNFLEMLAILLLAAALCYTFGAMIGESRQGWALLIAMNLFFVPLLALTVAAESSGNRLLDALPVEQSSGPLQPGGNLEGKEVRFGVVNSALWAVATTAASNGSVNAMHDSFTPLGGLATLFLMQLGEIVYGGVGSGLYGMLLFVLVAVFVAGLMVGRSPEYLGKRIGFFEIKMATIAILAPPLLVLFGTALALQSQSALAGIQDGGPHGFSEILYAFTSQGNNNGSAFAGFGADSPVVNLLGGGAMFFARYWVILPVLAIAGAMARKKKIPTSAGTLPTHTPLFVGWLAVVILVVGALSFLPALALGPIAEQLLFLQRLSF